MPARYAPPNDFRIIQEADFSLAGTNIPITEAKWVSGTNYLLDDLVYLDGTHPKELAQNLYRSTFGTASEPNTTNPITEAQKTDKQAETNPRGWVLVGKINRYEMFSEVVSRQSIKESPIEVLLDVPDGTNSVAMFNVDGATKAMITAYDASGNALGTWQEDFATTLASSKNWSWWLYFHRSESPTSEAVNIGLPLTGVRRIKVVIEGPGTIGIGKLVTGKANDVGIALLPWEGGLYSASTVDRDVFGAINLVRRASAKYGVYTILVPRYRIDAVQNMLEAALNVPTVFMVDQESPEAILFGILKEVRTIRTEEHPDWGKMKLEIMPLI